MKRYLRFYKIFLMLVVLLTVANTFVAKADTKVPKFQLNKLLVSGDDSERIVFLIVGDGFTAKEQKLFNQKASEIKDYILNVAPFSEFKKDMNFYSLNVISKESGAGNNPSHLKDTYFQSSFYYAYNIERLLAPHKPEKAYELAEAYVPEYDNIIMIVNDDRYGGSGGTIPVTSINTHSYEIIIHEMGHSIGGLADEYWAGDYYAMETFNMTQENDPKKVPWSKFIGIDGIGVYPYEENPTWFRPYQNCKMRYLGKEYPFCDVCKQALEDRLENLTWQTNLVTIYEDLLEEIKVYPAKKTLYTGAYNGNSVMIKTTQPSVLHKVTKLSSNKIKATDIEVVFTYQSSNRKIVTVTNSGKVTAKNPGKAKILVTARLADGTMKVFEIPITVANPVTKG